MFKFMTILAVVVELIHAEGRRNMIKLIVAFRNYAKKPNKSK
jgi:hypothetical protein